MPRLALAVSVSQDMRGHMRVVVTRYHICFLLDDTWLRDVLTIRRRERETNTQTSFWKWEQSGPSLGFPGEKA